MTKKMWAAYIKWCKDNEIPPGTIGIRLTCEEMDLLLDLEPAERKAFFRYKPSEDWIKAH